METPAYFQISPLTGYAMFIFHNAGKIEEKKLVKFSEEYHFVACLTYHDNKDILMICRILGYSDKDSFRQTQKEIKDIIREETGLTLDLLPDVVVSMTYEVNEFLYANDSTESYLPF